MRTPLPARKTVFRWITVVVLLAGCGPAQAAQTGVNHGHTPEPSVAVVTGRQPPTSAPPTSAMPPSPARPADKNSPRLQWYLDRLPQFPPPPQPEQVALPHAPGQAAWVKRIPTTQPVAFITIDDGWVKRPEALELLRASGVPVTLFLTVNAVKSDTDYFRDLQRSGAMIESHTITHRNLRGMSYAEQKHEICGSSDWLGAQYGRRPTLFRPPFGEKDDNTLRAAHDCGIESVFFWTETANKGKVFYQTSDKRVQAGDIILMHFREAYAADFLAVLTAIKAAGLTPALLEDYVSPDRCGTGSKTLDRVRAA